MADYDLAIIGSGSGNSLVTPDFDGARVAIIEAGTFGGTCLNVGCIPTKMYVYAAYVASTISGASRYGIDATLDRVRWPDIRDRIFGRIDPISAGGRQYRAQGPNTELLEGHVEFVGERRLRMASGREFDADQIVIAAGSRPVIPTVIGESGVPFHTSDTIMRIDELPARLLVLGGGYIAAELASVFAALGVQVTVINRGPALLREQDADVSRVFTAHATSAWHDVRLGVTVSEARQSGAEIVLDLSDGSQICGDVMLVATGRQPNTDGLGLDKAGIARRDDGRVEVDCYGRTSVAGVWALGDVSSPYQLKHVANHEARVVAHNLVHPQALREFDHRFVPAAVFAEPQIASVGMTEQQAIDAGIDAVCATQEYGGTAYGWAMEDSEGFCKLVADRSTGRLVGAHILGHDASVLIQPLVQAITFGQRAADVAAGQYWIHPALTEVVENALLKLGLD